jgi:hypothetical protein
MDRYPLVEEVFTSLIISELFALMGGFAAVVLSTKY